MPNCSAGAAAGSARPSAGRSARPLSWHAVAFGVATFHSAAEHALLQAAADTWLRMVEGADLLLTPRDASGGDPKFEHATYLSVCGHAAYVHAIAHAQAFANVW